MTADGRIDMMDIIGMLSGGELDLTPPKSCGRIVTGFNGLIVGLETKSEGLEDNMVYEIESKGGIFTLKKKGTSHLKFNDSNSCLSTLLLMEQQKLILTETEKNRLNVENETRDNGFLTTRDRYLIESDKNIEGAEEKLKTLYIMYPMSKHPEKWI